MKTENNFNSPEQILDAIDKPRIVVGTATCGLAAGSMKVLKTIREELERHSIDANVTEVGCIGLCFAEPLVDIIKPGKPRIVYGELLPSKVAVLIEDYLINDNPRPDLALGSIGEDIVKGIPRLSELPVFRSQVRVTLRHCGHIDPEKIDDYISVGGYKALAKALKQMNAQQIINEIKRSFLRGRGGAGF
ncbi:MAG: NADH-quinone oxidoreductase subunit F, partial [Dehalococcoidia bacterium]